MGLVLTLRGLQSGSRKVPEEHLLFGLRNGADALGTAQTPQKHPQLAFQNQSKFNENLLFLSTDGLGYMGVSFLLLLFKKQRAQL